MDSPSKRNGIPSEFDGLSRTNAAPQSPRNAVPRMTRESGSPRGPAGSPLSSMSPRGQAGSPRGPRRVEHARHSSTERLSRLGISSPPVVVDADVASEQDVGRQGESPKLRAAQDSRVTHSHSRSVSREGSQEGSAVGVADDCGFEAREDSESSCSSPRLLSSRIQSPSMSPNLIPSPQRSPLSRPGWPLFLPKVASKVARVHGKSGVRLEDVKVTPKPAPQSPGPGKSPSRKRPPGRSRLITQNQAPEAVKLKQIIDSATMDLDIGKMKFSDVFARTLAEASAIMSDAPKKPDQHTVGSMLRLPVISEKLDEVETPAPSGPMHGSRSMPALVQPVPPAWEPVPAPPYVVLLASAAAAISVFLIIVAIILQVLSSTGTMANTPFRPEFFYMAVLVALVGLQALRAIQNCQHVSARNALIVAWLLDVFLIAESFTISFTQKSTYKHMPQVRAPFIAITFVDIILVTLLLILVEHSKVLQQSRRQAPAQKADNVVSENLISLDV